jgi:CheY-like chemotaxis protein
MAPENTPKQEDFSTSQKPAAAGSVHSLAKAWLPEREHKPLVLLCEDDPGQIPLYSAYLDQAGFVVKACLNGSEALEYLESLRARGEPLPDVVLTDRKMPGGLFGDQLAKELRRAGFLMPIFLHTTDQEFVGNKIDIGANEKLEFRSKSMIEETCDAIVRLQHPKVHVQYEIKRRYLGILAGEGQAHGATVKDLIEDLHFNDWVTRSLIVNSTGGELNPNLQIKVNGCDIQDIQGLGTGLSEGVEVQIHST